MLPEQMNKKLLIFVSEETCAKLVPGSHFSVSRLVVNPVKHSGTFDLKFCQSL